LPSGSVNHAVLSSLDIVPLAVSLAGGTLPTDRTFDGRDPLPALRDEKYSAPRALYWAWNQGRREQWRGLRDGPWKLLRSADNEPWELYDLSHDIGEQHNLAASQPERLAAMIRQFEAWRSRIAADPSRANSLRQ
jgi:arylsulfatase A-like enzyme